MSHWSAWDPESVRDLNFQPKPRPEPKPLSSEAKARIAADQAKREAALQEARARHQAWLDFIEPNHLEVADALVEYLQLFGTTNGSWYSRDERLAAAQMLFYDSEIIIFVVDELHQWGIVEDEISRLRGASSWKGSRLANRR
jgi:hypothetical protein